MTWLPPPSPSTTATTTDTGMSFVDGCQAAVDASPTFCAMTPCETPSEPTATPAPKPTSVPTPKPTSVPTPKPTSLPTPKPTSVPTPKHTSVPTPKPTSLPTPKPTPTSASCSGATVALWAKCSGQGYTGSTCCGAGAECVYQTVWYSQCNPEAPTPRARSSCSCSCSLRSHSRYPHSP